MYLSNMRKQVWPSVLFQIAFAISLAHSSLPHAHPSTPENPSQSTGSHHHQAHASKDHQHHDSEHSHDHDSDLPVFSHFSNADFISNVKLIFSGKVKVLKAVNIFTQTIIIYAPLKKAIDKTPPIHRARELPILHLSSANSLRGPPIYFNQSLG